MALSIQIIAMLRKQDSDKPNQHYLLLLDENLRLTDIVRMENGLPILISAFKDGLMSQSDQDFWSDHLSELQHPPVSFEGALHISEFVRNQMSLDLMGACSVEIGSPIKIGVRGHGIALPTLFFIGTLIAIKELELIP